ncbi:MAG TPA: UDP-glucose 4-epimerase GalE [Thermoleophilia bacterium]
MKILVTGGAGYIGSITTRVLVEAGHHVVVLDSLEKGFAPAVDPGAELVVATVDDDEVLDLVLPGVDVVMHLAGYIEVAESQTDPGRYLDNNVSAPLVLLEAMVRHGVPGLVFSSTAAVYGEPKTVPIKESAQTLPLNAYGLSKLMFEQWLDWFERVHGVRSVRFRYFNVAGAWADGSMGEAHRPETHLIPRVLEAMAQGQKEFEVFGGDYPTADGTCVRDYIHVLDLARAHLNGLEWLHAGRKTEIFNLGNGRGFSNLEVVKTCAAVTGVEVEVKIGARRAGDPAALVASSERAAKVLGWAPEETDLAGIVGDAWKWHRSHPEGYETGQRIWD